MSAESTESFVLLSQWLRDGDIEWPFTTITRQRHDYILSRLLGCRNVDGMPDVMTFTPHYDAIAERENLEALDEFEAEAGAEPAPPAEVDIVLED
jgi:hypothetical protein